MPIEGDHVCGYKIRHLEASFIDRRDLCSHYLSSAPYGGVLFSTIEKIAPGDVVVVTIKLETERIEADLLGAVIWVRERQEAGDAEVAVGFFESEVEQREALLGHGERNSKKERREPRFPVALPVTFTNDRSFLLARTRNVSRSGVCIEALSAPEYEIIFTLHSMAGCPPLLLRGRVVWCRPGVDFGVEIQRDAVETSRALDLLVERLVPARSYMPESDIGRDLS